MPKKEAKKTITVSLSWFSSGPVFKQALETVTAEIKGGQTLTETGREKLGELLPLNGGQPFTGETSYGPHTTIRFEAEGLSQAISAAEILRAFLEYRFSAGQGTGGIYVRFAGKPLSELIGSLETALVNARRDLSGTRRFFPSKNIQALRTNFEALYA